MRPSESFSAEAIVLKVFPYEESHSLVKLLLPDHGKLSCFARGAQNSRKRFGAFLQPGMRVLAHLKAPRLETSQSFFNLDLVEGLGAFSDWSRDYDRIQSVMFSLSLSNSALPDGPVDTRIYDNLKQYLDAVSLLSGKGRHDWLRMLFWLNLSMLLGHAVLVPEVNQKIRLLYQEWSSQESSVDTSLSSGMGYEFLGQMRDVPELGRADFSRVGQEWRRVSENDWDYTKILYL